MPGAALPPFRPVAAACIHLVWAALQRQSRWQAGKPCLASPKTQRLIRGSRARLVQEADRRYLEGWMGRGQARKQVIQGYKFPSAENIWIFPHDRSAVHAAKRSTAFLVLCARGMF